MSNRLDFGRQNGAQVGNANRKEIRAGDIQNVTVSDSDWTEVYIESSTNTKRYAPGYGYGNRDSSEAGYADFDLQDNSSTPVAVDGNFRWVLYESEDHDVPIKISSDISSTALRNSVSASLTDKQLHPGRTPAGKQDRELVLEFKASTGSNGDTIDPANCETDSGIPYSMFRK